MTVRAPVATGPRAAPPEQRLRRGRARTSSAAPPPRPLPLIYVPNSKSDTVDVIDPRTYRIVDHFAVGACPSTSSRRTT